MWEKVDEMDEEFEWVPNTGLIGPYRCGECHYETKWLDNFKQEYL